MELTKFDIIRDAVPVQLRDPTDAGVLLWDKKDPNDPSKETNDQSLWKPVSMLIYGRDSKPFKNRQRAIQDKRLQEAQTSAMNKGQKAKVTGEVVELENRRTLLACIAGWENIEVDGAPLEVSEENANALLDRFPWIEEQVDTAIMDRSNFIKPSSKTS